jgi:signal transduction histidine kinase
MRLVAAALGVLLLLALLTWLLLRGIDTNVRTYPATLQTFDDFALAEASLQRDVLQARAGLLRDYDPFGSAEDAMEDAVARLRSYARSWALSTEPIDHLGEAIAQQEELTERFKSSNSVFQNSLAYVGLTSTGPTFGSKDTELAPATGAMAAAILRLERDTSPAAVQALQERIDQLAAQAPVAGPDAQAAQALLAHTRLLRDLLPAIDATLKALVAVPTEPPLEAARALFGDHRAAVEATAQRYRLLLYLASLLLVVALVRLGLRLRARALALRRRAAFEHVIAENSTRLINCSPAETAARLTQVLAELGRAMGGVERAYVVLAENPPRVHAWCADEAPFPAGWPEDALALSAQLGEGGHDIVTVPDVAAMPPGDAKNKLRAVGLRGWACVSLNRPGRVRGIMAFDKFQPAWSTVFPVPVVLLAADAVANAIDREFLERDRARLATRLERARRMQTIGSLASGIAHNFNNIIGAILGYSEMAEPELAPGSKPAEHIDEIKRAAERGRDLVDHILTFGRRRDVRARPIEVRAQFDEAASLLRATLPEGVELVIADVPADIAVLGEPAQLQQVILNLCNNAAQAMEGRGRIRVAAEQKDLAAPSTTMSHGELAPGRYVCLSVDDTGRGFDESVARRLFEPFFTTRSAGTGLGLATVQEIVRDYDGAMNVQSDPGHGSRFEAWLPAPAIDGSSPIDPVGAPLGRGETVLVVESERERLLRGEEVLAALGYEPVGFERADEAIAACRAAPDRFDIMLIGYLSHPLDGLDVARVLHGIAPQCPVLLVAISTTEISVDALAQAGIVEVLCRPIATTELAAILARCLCLRSPGALGK